MNSNPRIDNAMAPIRHLVVDGKPADEGAARILREKEADIARRTEPLKPIPATEILAHDTVQPESAATPAVAEHQTMPEELPPLRLRLTRRDRFEARAAKMRTKKSGSTARRGSHDELAMQALSTLHGGPILLDVPDSVQPGKFRRVTLHNLGRRQDTKHLEFSMTLLKDGRFALKCRGLDQNLAAVAPGLAHSAPVAADTQEHTHTNAPAAAVAGEQAALPGVMAPEECNDCMPAETSHEIHEARRQFAIAIPTVRLELQTIPGHAPARADIEHLIPERPDAVVDKLVDGLLRWHECVAKDGDWDEETDRFFNNLDDYADAIIRHKRAKMIVEQCLNGWQDGWNFEGAPSPAITDLALRLHAAIVGLMEELAKPKTKQKDLASSASVGE